MIQFIISFLRLFKNLFIRFGVDFEQLTTIIAIKLTVDSRVDKSGKGKRNVTNSLVKQGISLGGCGLLFFGVSAFQGTLSTTLLVFHTILMLMLIANFLMEYSFLLFNSNDNHVLLRMPVSPKTVVTAKLVSMLVYMLFLSLSTSVIPILITCFWKGPVVGLSFFIAVVINTFFSLILANTIYLGVMNFVSGEKMQKFISYAQIFLMLGMIFGYQAITPLVSSGVFEFSSTPDLWVYFIPPTYFMALTELVIHPTLAFGVLGLIGLLLPLLMLFVTLQFFAPGFTARITELDSFSGGNTKNGKRGEKTVYRLAAWFAKPPLQQAGFLLAWRMTRNNLKFNQAVLPGGIYAFMFIGFTIYRYYTSSEAVSSFLMITPLYFIPIMGALVVGNMVYSDYSNLLWIYQSKALEKPGALLLGAFKAVFIKYVVSLFLIIATVILVFTGIKVVGDILFIFSFITFFCLVVALMSYRFFPFSKEKSDMESGNNTLKTMLVMLLCGVLFFIHFLLNLISYGPVIAIPLIWLLIFWASRKIVNTPWEKIESNYK